MPRERSATADPGRLSVGFDATALLGSPTGVGVFCAGALAALSDRDDVAVSAFAISWRRRKGIETRVPPGVATGQLAMPARPLHRAWGLGRLPPVEWFIGRRDVVHGPNFVVPPTRRAARVLSLWDLTVVLYPELCDPPTLEYPALIRRAVGEGAWVHVPTRFVAEQAIAELGVDPDRVRTVSLGIPPSARRRPGASDSPSPTGAAATCWPSGPSSLARTTPCSSRRSPRWPPPSPTSRLVIVGRDGWGSERFAAAVEASPVRSRIVRPGYLDDRSLGAALGGASVLAYPSVYEGFGFPPLQAMAAGVPVVATAAGAVPEVVGDGARLVEPGDEDGLAAALIQVLDGGADVDDQVARGSRRTARFSWTACAEGLAELYADATAELAPGRRPAARPER